MSIKDKIQSAWVYKSFESISIKNINKIKNKQQIGKIAVIMLWTTSIVNIKLALYIKKKIKPKWKKWIKSPLLEKKIQMSNKHENLMISV